MLFNCSVSRDIIPLFQNRFERFIYILLYMLITDAELSVALVRELTRHLTSHELSLIIWTKMTDVIRHAYTFAEITTVHGRS